MRTETVSRYHSQKLKHFWKWYHTREFAEAYRDAHAQRGYSAEVFDSLEVLDDGATRI